ncbi:MAG: SUF system NifU family Fe-S cluster assembly protein [Gammaproteobacteria bacterium RIFCSPLOWO2_02_FULL_42_14]|nr:MAG: SUF system NifU family Fe-S cluster assembly protein [Gammaproteobacteria bacterium RIFCSPHIGHO2_02_FULL_42_43]OGT28821.1 MAG: SUF system NifU family Fe-S cluster assembly protein [Gammaproteobacteria bacterium RIFCSPHIGHO2_01_FULL_42_8]OGT52243.1 MAG: SUF system NifU family Fe-S cluster assembly protein [Gammaproteobacteria bacterium RIFCSPHIGHO2_12_FULL_41_25]OGT61856.1 MAG: SUF system NifU family Fe-S cluster assembly protein [Gammaproteobacteria bacterium RIFCSPLOWO2_02_FULL_42_14]O
MSNLNELYQELIIDHSRHPRNFFQLQDATVQKEGVNPLCGDRLMLFLKTENGVIENASFEGSGCAISVASASLMTDYLKKKSFAEIKEIFLQFHQMLMGESYDETLLKKLLVFKSVNAFPMRVKCATLAWHALMAIIKEEPCAQASGLLP